MPHRLIPKLEVKGESLTKGVGLEGLRVLGQASLFAKHYFEQGADEIVYIDAVASLYRRNNLTQLVSHTAKNVLIPLTVGGGVRTLHDVEDLLNAGADKIAVNSAALENPQLINEIVRRFGSSTLVISIQSNRIRGQSLAFYDSGRTNSGKLTSDWAREAYDRGAGEILLTSIDRDGSGKGFDLDLVECVLDQVPIPVVASGGAGLLEHVLDASKVCEAVSVASMIHYSFIGSGNYDGLPTPGLKRLETSAFQIQEVLTSPKNIQPTEFKVLKAHCQALGFKGRRSES